MAMAALLGLGHGYGFGLWGLGHGYVYPKLQGFCTTRRIYGYESRFQICRLQLLQVFPAMDLELAYTTGKHRVLLFLV
jgi:hypothetical protein